MSAFESNKQGLEEARAFATGHAGEAVVREIATPKIDASELRKDG